MTREEAINDWTFRSNHIKKWLDEHGEEPNIRHYVELIDMAIEALSNADQHVQHVQRVESVDLISRQNAIDALGEKPDIWNDTEEEWAYRNAWVEHISAIKSLPSADRPTGKWIEDEYCDQHCICSNCGGSSGTQFDGIQPIPLKTKFCPHCGAKMKGDEK